MSSHRRLTERVPCSFLKSKELFLYVFLNICAKMCICLNICTFSWSVHMFEQTSNSIWQKKTPEVNIYANVIFGFNKTTKSSTNFEKLSYLLLPELYPELIKCKFATILSSNRCIKWILKVTTRATPSIQQAMHTFGARKFHFQQNDLTSVEQWRWPTLVSIAILRVSVHSVYISGTSIAITGLHDGFILTEVMKCDSYITMPSCDNVGIYH